MATFGRFQISDAQHLCIISHRWSHQWLEEPALSGVHRWSSDKRIPMKPHMRVFSWHETIILWCSNSNALSYNAVILFMPSHLSWALELGVTIIASRFSKLYSARKNGHDLPSASDNCTSSIDCISLYIYIIYKYIYI